MAEVDTVWTAFGLFLLACGGVPAAAALIIERRGQTPCGGVGDHATNGRTAVLFHEPVRSAAPADLECRHSVTAPGRAPARPQACC